MIMSFVIYKKPKTLRIENLEFVKPFIYLFSKCKLFFHTVQFCLDECNELQYHDPVLVSNYNICPFHFFKGDRKPNDQLTKTGIYWLF